jgi:hypothetical protein
MPKSPPGAHCLREEGTAGGVSRGFAMVGFQQSTETLDANDLTLTSLMLRLDDPVETLVNPFLMIVGEIFGEDVA